MLQLLFAIVAGFLARPLADSPQMFDVVRAESWMLSARPVIEIDGDWGSVVGLRRVASGQIVVADQMSRRISLYDRNGRHLASAGRSGDGPGEFRTVMRPMSCGGDSIFIWDPAMRRVTVYDHQAKYQRVFSDADVLSPEAGTALRRVVAMNCNDRGVFVTTFRSIDNYPTKEGPARVEVRIEMAEEGGKATTLGPFRGDELYFLDGMISPRPLGTRTLSAIGSDRLYIGTTDRFSVDVFSLSGQHLKTISDDVQRTPLSRRILNAFLATRPEAHRAAWAAMEYPDHLPAFSDLLADEVGNVWIEEYRNPGQQTSTWRIYSADGQRRATLAMPERFRPFQVGSDFVLGVSRDEFDTERVRLYRLTKDPSRD